MRDRFLASLGALAVMIAVVASVPVRVTGQAPVTAAKANSSTPARTPWGHPDLQGIWNNSTTTPLERSSEFAGKAFLTDEEVARRDGRVGEARNTDRAPSKGDPGTYNEFWWERGATVANKRTSLITDPPDGKIPAFTPEGQKKEAALMEARRQRGPADSWADRPLQERCIAYHGVPPLPTGYNNNYHIVQTPEYVAILYEMLHEIRLIPLEKRPHIGQRITQYLGDSRGRWEGSTLVVETTNFKDDTYSLRTGRLGGDVETSPQPAVTGTNRPPLPVIIGSAGILSSGEKMRVIERFTRVAENMIDYEFTIEDPATFTTPWKGSLPMLKAEGPIFEYACHEGNYGMVGILAGHRADEKAAAEAVKKDRSR